MRHLCLELHGDERQKIEKLRTSLAPLLVELTRLQVGAGVFQCVTTQVTDPTSPLSNPLPDDALEPFAVGAQPTVEDLLAHWDTVVQDLDESPVPTTPAWPPPTRSSQRTCSVGPLVEDQILYLPSNRNVTPRNDDQYFTVPHRFRPKSGNSARMAPEFIIRDSQAVPNSLNWPYLM